MLKNKFSASAIIEGFLKSNEPTIVLNFEDRDTCKKAERKILSYIEKKKLDLYVSKVANANKIYIVKFGKHKVEKS